MKVVDVIIKSLKILGVYNRDTTLSSEEVSDAIISINSLIAAWEIETTLALNTEIVFATGQDDVEYLPAIYIRLLTYQLANELALEYGLAQSPTLVAKENKLVADVKRFNRKAATVELTELSVLSDVFGKNQTYYNINTD